MIKGNHLKGPHKLCLVYVSSLIWLWLALLSGNSIFSIIGVINLYCECHIWVLCVPWWIKGSFFLYFYHPMTSRSACIWVSINCNIWWIICAINSCNWLLCRGQKFLLCCVQTLNFPLYTWAVKKQPCTWHFTIWDNSLAIRSSKWVNVFLFFASHTFFWRFFLQDA